MVGFEVHRAEQAEDKKEAARHAREGQTYPVVRFANGRVITVWPTMFFSEVPPFGTCQRVQVFLFIYHYVDIIKHMSCSPPSRPQAVRGITLVSL